MAYLARGVLPRFQMLKIAMMIRHRNTGVEVAPIRSAKFSV
jgi:hypothetical protein